MNSKPPSALDVSSTGDITLPPGLEVKETYEQGKVPLYNVVNATLITSQLIYKFAAMKLDIKKMKTYGSMERICSRTVSCLKKKSQIL